MLHSDVRAEAYATRNEGNNAMHLAVYNDDVLIGFVMIGKGTVCSEEEKEVNSSGFVLMKTRKAKVQ